MSNSKIRNRRVYKIVPSGLLDLERNSRAMQYQGAEVQKIQPFGCPPNGTMGMCYVQTVEGDFVGLVNEASLVKTRKTAPVRDKAAEAREARSARYRR